MRDDVVEPEASHVPGFDPRLAISPAPYLPFLDAHRGKPPGLWALDWSDWVEIDANYAPQMAYRDRLIAETGEVVARAIPGSEAAIAELWDKLTAHLLERHPDSFAREGAAIRRADGVLVEPDGVRGLGRLTQEDWCLLDRAEGAEEYGLIAANLCFPSFWSLAEKIGRPMAPIHEKVPGFAEQLLKRVNRVFAALHVDRPLQRLNWSVPETGELHLPGLPRAYAGGGAFHLRVERQTISRLPETGAAVFSIKTYVTPLRELAEEARRALAAEVRAMDAAHADYKGGETWRASVLAILDA